MLDDFEDDIVDIANMDDTQHEKSKALPYRKSSKQRTLSQMVGEAGSYSKKSKVWSRPLPHSCIVFTKLLPEWHALNLLERFVSSYSISYNFVMSALGVWAEGSEYYAQNRYEGPSTLVAKW
jgi:hypothetical protein